MQTCMKRGSSDDVEQSACSVRWKAAKEAAISREQGGRPDLVGLRAADITPRWWSIVARVPNFIFVALFDASGQPWFVDSGEIEVSRVRRHPRDTRSPLSGHPRASLAIKCPQVRLAGNWHPQSEQLISASPRVRDNEGVPWTEVFLMAGVRTGSSGKSGK